MKSFMLITLIQPFYTDICILKYYGLDHKHIFFNFIIKTKKKKQKEGSTK